jgi:undecaprenyl-diphosphatase
MTFGHALRLLFLLLFFWASVATAQEEEVVAAHGLSYTDAVILGLVEGLTEFLPVSSTGHLVLVNHLLGFNSEDPARDRAGNLLYAHGLDELTGSPLTIKNLADSYAIVIQIGAIAAVMIIFWSRVRAMALGVLGKNPQGLLLARNLLAAFLPAVVIGLLLEDWIDRYLFDSLAVVFALFAGGLLMLAVEAWRRRKAPDAGEGPDLHEITLGQSLTVGLLQCVAMWPGTSRSMMTIVGGYFIGLSPRRAAEFSFLLGLITLSAASLYKGAKGGTFMLAAFGFGPLLVGCLVAAVSAAIAVKWMISYLSRRGLGAFAWYRMGLALVVLWFI